MAGSAEIIPINIEDEMKGAYLDYSMSVIVGRALPDVRDGLKPVHRRILYAMFREGLLSSKRYSKCAGVVGEVLKKYHPHGDSSVYDALVRMAQYWNMRHLLIDGQGNFGSVDGDPPAAYRYTEARLTKLAEEMLADIDKNTVAFGPNFDSATTEPHLLPSKVPNLLLNGSEGIAVGMATKIPPHNLAELCSAVVALIQNPELTQEEIYKIIPGPDFPTGAFIYGTEGIREYMQTGRGIITLRAKAAIEKIAKGDREAIIVTEIPYQVNKAKLIERIAELVREAKVEGISDLRDESDRDGMRIVVELKRGSIAAVVLNQLYKHTAMQSSFGVITLAIVQGQPKVLSLRQYLGIFIDHRKEIVTRRTLFELRKAEDRAHILEGLKIALDNIDEMIELIKKSKNPEEAKNELIKRFTLSVLQAQAILEMRLQRLTGLERDKIIAEYNEILALIKELKSILADERKVYKIIVDETEEIKRLYANARRTEIQSSTGEISIEDMIQEEDMVVTISHTGYIKRNPISLYRAQRRGGKGKTGMTTKEEDFVENLFIASTHTYLLVFSTYGKVYWLKVYDIPQAGRTTKGKAIVNVVNMAGNESVAAVLPVKEFVENKYVFLATRNGTVKKTDLMAYSNPRAGGIIALGIEEGDALIDAQLTDGSQDILMSTKGGMSIRYKEDEVRSMGRNAVGVRGMRLEEGDKVVAMQVLNPGASVLTVSEHGYGKRTTTDEYRIQGRGGVGIITMKVTDKTGPVVSAQQVLDTDEIMVISDGGKIIRLKVKDISIIGRNTQGVRLLNVDEKEKVTAVAKLAESEEEEVSVEGEEENPGSDPIVSE
ncbi:MAG: DNA gyrase subunit A [Deltaproteobacteria bacterium]|nr:DNA gyrase subunit A [Deltaproteobacteria bacterium]